MAQIKPELYGFEIEKYTGSFVHKISENFHTASQISYYNYVEGEPTSSFPSLLELGFYSGSIVVV